MKTVGLIFLFAAFTAQAEEGFLDYHQHLNTDILQQFGDMLLLVLP